MHRLIHLGNSAEGGDINSGVGSEYPDLMADLVSSGEADLGLAHDGDGDRLVLCDESGAILSGDEVLGIVGLDLIKEAISMVLLLWGRYSVTQG